MKSNTRLFFWTLAAIIIYLGAGFFFPFELWNEFGCKMFGSQQPYGGVQDYALHYPHIVLYPLCWFPFALIALTIAFYTIHSLHGTADCPKFWRLGLFSFLTMLLVVAVVAAVGERQNPGTMLFELPKSAQARTLASFSLTNSVQELLTNTVAELVFHTLEPNPGIFTNSQSQFIRTNLLSPSVWVRLGYSVSHLAYLATFTGIVFAMLATVLAASFTACIPQGSPLRQRAVRATIGSAAALCLWFPLRINYNAKTKAPLFGTLLYNNFDLWIPDKWLKMGLTSVEAIPLLFLVVFATIVIFVVFRKEPQKLLKAAMEWLAIIGVSGASILALVSPDIFARLVGLDGSGHWLKLVIVTMVLLALFIVYLVFTLWPAPEDTKGSRV